jgi:hypothetical protein
MDFYTGLAISIVLAILGLLSWTFKSEIEKFSEKRKKSVEVNIEKVQKEIGKPNSIEKGIQHYNSRDRISLKEILDNTTDTVEMSALTFSVIKDNDLSLIERKLKKELNLLSYYLIEIQQ